jgi:hypothetical protein
MTLNESRELGDRADRPLVSRFTILFVASLLVAQGLGRSLPGEMAELLSLAGLAGMAAYAGLELAAHYRLRNRAESLQHAAEGRLSLRMKAPAARPELRVDAQQGPSAGRHASVWEACGSGAWVRRGARGGSEA